jgi:hypothetical protein
MHDGSPGALPGRLGRHLPAKQADRQVEHAEDQSQEQRRHDRRLDQGHAPAFSRLMSAPQVMHSMKTLLLRAGALSLQFVAEFPERSDTALAAFLAT